MRRLRMIILIVGIPAAFLWFRILTGDGINFFNQCLVLNNTCSLNGNGAGDGAGLAFLWFNAYPAEVFMGDVGALALGAALGMVALVVRQEIVLLIMGGLFVVETLSVVIQVLSFKLTGKRVFRMAPIHHHFELKGWKENQVVVRFWIITMMLVLSGLSTLKLR